MRGERMSTRMTDDQRTAVRKVAGDLAISAGAGSGKTTVLAHRFAHALDSAADAPWAPADVDRILTITFTNKAAGEIAERVRRVLNSEVSTEAGRCVSEAWISTIHTFCGRLVRRHLLEAGVDPRFVQLDDVAAAMLKTEAFQGALDSLYGSDAAASKLLDRVPLTTLRPDIVAAHDNIRAMGLDPAYACVPNVRDELSVLRLAVYQSADRLAAEIDACKQTPTMSRKRQRLHEWHAELASCELSDERVCEKLIELHRDYDLSRLGAASAANKEFKAVLSQLAEAAMAATCATELLGYETLLRTFATQYKLRKAERHAIDFDDLQELAAELLENDSPLAGRYREHFLMLMIDEFQDTNDLQMRVLEPLRNNNLCVVGDERQSIYGFRYANVEIFDRVRGELSGSVDLKENFRSHPEILSFVNEVFAQTHLFGPEFMRLEAGKTEGWAPAAPQGDPRVECLIVDTESSNKSAAVATEAENVADRVAQLILAGRKGGEMAILLRNASNAALFAQALERRDVPVLVSAGVDLFDATETAEIVWLLRSIAVPGDDEALLAVLSGRMVRLSDDALFALRNAAGKEPLWLGLEAVALERSGAPKLSDRDSVAARKAYRILNEANRTQGTTSLHELIHDVLEEFDYDLTLFGLGATGLRAWANVLKIVRYAEQYESVESGDLAAFGDYLRERGDGSKDKAAPAEAGEDVVRIMTIHAAKGLEFAVVFAADLGARQCHTSTSSALVTKQRTSEGDVPLVGVKFQVGDDDLSATTPLYMRLREGAKSRDIEEQKRCLYVACTRAEEKLVISGATAVSKPAEEGTAIVDWIRQAVGDPAATSTVRVGDTDVLVTLLETQEIDHPSEGDSSTHDAPLAVDEGAHRQPETHAVRPRHVSYSSMHTHEQCPLSYRLRFVAPLGQYRDPAMSTASDFGSALHATMEVSRGFAPSADVVEAAVRRFRLTDEGRTRLHAAASAFASSPIATRLASCDRVMREEPFRLALGDTALTGAIDVLAFEKDSALIVDFKTGRAPSGSAQARLSGYELQAKCYALAAFAVGAQSAEAVFSFVEQGPTELSFAFSADDAPRIREEIESRIEAMAVDTSTHKAEYDPEACSFCPGLGGVCPVAGPQGALR